MCTVWIVLKLNDYDDREIVAVCSTEEKARAVLQFYEHKYGMIESYWIVGVSTNPAEKRRLAC